MTVPSTYINSGQPAHQNIQRSPQDIEKDQAILMARRVLRGDQRSCTEGDARILARQLLRALALAQ